MPASSSGSARRGELGKRLVPRKRWRKGLGAAGLLVYLLLLAFNLFAGINRGSSWNVRAGPLDAPFEIWFVGSVLGFFIIMYIRGRYEKTGSQLYVNRGIGTISPSIRLGARPEITVLELTRG